MIPEMESAVPLATLVAQSPHLTAFLHSYFKRPEDLQTAPQILARIESENVELMRQRTAVHESLAAFAVEAAHGCGDALATFSQLSARVSDAADRADSASALMGPLVEELASLAAEVARVERIRVYIEKMLEIEGHIGSAEEAFLFLKREDSSAAVVASAVSAFRSASGLVTDCTRSHPQWTRMLMSAETRLERMAKELERSARREYCSCLVDCGWPPPLGKQSAARTVSPASEPGSPHSHPSAGNPLTTLSGHLKTNFETLFIALSTLQVSETERHRASSSLLWSIEELGSTVLKKAESHFDKWRDQPELVFALSQRVAQGECVEIEGLLQPLLDCGRLPGVSAREEWVRAVVSSFRSYLARRTLPWLVSRVRGEGSVGSGVGGRLWLDTVDQALGFDHQMRRLAKGVAGRAGEELVGPQVGSCVGVFTQTSDWLALWARLEREEWEEKVRGGVGAETFWVQTPESAESGDGPPGEFRPCPAAELVLEVMWDGIGRCRTVEAPPHQLAFVRAAAAPLADDFCRELLTRARVVEASTALADTDSMTAVATLLSAAHFCEHRLREWGEDVFFLELRQWDDRVRGDGGGEEGAGTGSGTDREGTVFDDEVDQFLAFQRDWLAKIVGAIVRGFEARCAVYLRNKRRWEEMDRWQGESFSMERQVSSQFLAEVEAVDVSPSLAEALSVLARQLSGLKATLDNGLFSQVWRKVVQSLDRFVMEGVVVGDAVFSDAGGRQLAADLRGLFSVFSICTTRPHNFFKTLRDAALLLLMDAHEAAALLNVMSVSAVGSDTEEMQAGIAAIGRKHGIVRMSPREVVRVLRQRTSLQLY